MRESMGLRAAGLGGALAFLCLTQSCSPLWVPLVAGGAATVFVLPNSRLDPLYHRKYHGAGLSPATDKADGPLIGYVELDDFGWYRDREQPRAMLAALQEMSARENLVVVLYIHGWRHNSSDGDPDMKLFKATLAYLDREVSGDLFQEIRRRMSGKTSVRVVGIAVGWRGQAWPETQRWLPYLGQAIDLPVYPSAFGRKEVANVVGEGDLKGFISQLSALYDARWLKANSRSKDLAPLMSLVLVGHSFGGHALFDATRDQLEDRLSEAMVGSYVDSARGLPDRSIPSDHPAGPVKCRRLARGVGDLVLLINPAIEAASYRRVDRLVHSATFRSDQPPVLITVSSKNDGARNTVFRWLQFATIAGRASLGPEQRLEERLALGCYPKQVTNSLELISRSNDLLKRARRRVTDKAPEQLLSLQAAIIPKDRSTLLSSIANVDFSQTMDLGNVRLGPELHPVDNSPAMVLDTSSDLVNGHSDFFREEFIGWLSTYVLQVQLKRLAHNRKLQDLGATPEPGAD